MTTKTLSLTVTGIVQGVGFRPFIYRLAQQYRLKGYVCNNTEGVNILVQGPPAKLDAFVLSITQQKPAPAHIEQIESRDIKSVEYSDFSIRPSDRSSTNEIYISPDLSTCESCAQDIGSPANRRYRYPFTTCTYCGPRYSIIEDIPYDRDKTTMKSFRMCPDCQAEYEDPLDRRYHSQPNACPVCGPALDLFVPGKGEVATQDPLLLVVDCLNAGGIVALKGLGGYQLCCDAHNQHAVWAMRTRKHREAKPFAVMARDLEVAGRYVQLDDASKALLRSPENPVVLLPALSDSGVAPAVAPGNAMLGVMLPYTPLHLLLLEHFDLLVMTSANISDQPIIAENELSRVALSGIAEMILGHNRRIANRVDDSVYQLLSGQPQAIRRGRGFVPGLIKHPPLTSCILAVGGELKNTFAVNRGQTIFMGPHIGDLKNTQTYDFFQDSIREYLRNFGLTPGVIACDQHPQYLSSQWARQQSGTHRLIEVGHHHAHLASCMVEYALNRDVIGFAMDGTGYGSDGHIWGCESGMVSLSRFERLGHLDYIKLPGGDRCTDEISRIAFSLLAQTYGHVDPAAHPFLHQYPLNDLRIFQQMMDQQINTPLTSSMGRLFDGVSSLIGLGNHVAFDAQAAIALEAIAEACESGEYPVVIVEKNGSLIWDFRAIIEAIVIDRDLGVSPSVISARFHNTIVNYIVSMAQQLRVRSGLSDVVLSGGVFLNRRLSAHVEIQLASCGFNVYLQKKFPPGDGGLAIGQLAIAQEVI